MPPKQPITKELVDAHIENIPNLSHEDLVFLFQVTSSSSNRLLKPYHTALDKECKHRARPIKTKTIDEEVAEHKAKLKEEERKYQEQEY